MVTDIDYYKYDDYYYYVCVKIFLVSAYLQVGNNVPYMLIQTIYEWIFLYQIKKVVRNN
jgi:hypothetical protein